MSLPLYIPVTESLQQLLAALKKSSVMFQPRIKMLIAMKKAGEPGISKRALMDTVGVSSQSIHDWRTSYKQNGLTGLLTHGRTGFKPSSFTKEEHSKMEQKLKDPNGGLRGYIELQQWVNTEFAKDVKYNTVLKYAVRHFGSSIKVARKSHIKKDQAKVENLKKTSAGKSRK